MIPDAAVVFDLAADVADEIDGLNWIDLAARSRDPDMPDPEPKKVKPTGGAVGFRRDGGATEKGGRPTRNVPSRAARRKR